MKTKTSIDRTPNSIGCFKPAPLPHTAASGARDYTPLKSSDFAPVLRPGALDHEKHGSLQPDGSVKPFARIGYLSSNVRVNFAYREK